MPTSGQPLLNSSGQPTTNFYSTGACGCCNGSSGSSSSGNNGGTSAPCTCTQDLSANVYSIVNGPISIDTSRVPAGVETCDPSLDSNWDSDLDAPTVSYGGDSQCGFNADLFYCLTVPNLHIETIVVGLTDVTSNGHCYWLLNFYDSGGNLIWGGLSGGALPDSEPFEFLSGYAVGPRTLSLVLQT